LPEDLYRELSEARRKAPQKGKERSLTITYPLDVVLSSEQDIQSPAFSHPNYAREILDKTKD